MFRTSEAKKKAGSFCCAYNCSNKPSDKKGGLCHKHFARKRREEDPVGARFTQFRINAKNRNKHFDITLQQFRDFCKKTGYCIEKGKRGQNATIDRKINSIGYTIENIQLLTNKQNASKGTSDCPF
jgi:hypothetical protein